MIVSMTTDCKGSGSCPEVNDEADFFYVQIDVPENL